MEKFIQSRLEELQSPQETKNLIGELSSRITDHRGRVRELLRSEPLRHPEVIPLIMVGLAVDRPLESNFFPGLLEGLLGSLSIAAPREGNPPTSSCEGAGHAWFTAVCEAVAPQPGPSLQGGFPQKTKTSHTTSFLGPALHP